MLNHSHSCLYRLRKEPGSPLPQETTPFFLRRGQMQRKQPGSVAGVATALIIKLKPLRADPHTYSASVLGLHNQAGAGMDLQGRVGETEQPGSPQPSHPLAPPPPPLAPFGGAACCARGPRAGRLCWGAACSPAPPADPGSSAPGAHTPPSGCSRAEAERRSCRRGPSPARTTTWPAGRLRDRGRGRGCAQPGRRGSAGAAKTEGARGVLSPQAGPDCYSSRAGKRMVRGSAFSSRPRRLPPRGAHRWRPRGPSPPPAGPARLAGTPQCVRHGPPETARGPAPTEGSDSKKALEAAPPKNPTSGY